jgi:anaerobic selenocysteine-containing dehydrogenase
MIVYHGNPLLINADEKKVRKALEKLELLIVYDVFMTATAELADFVLPDASDVERSGFQAFSSHKGGMVALRQKIIEPIGECRPVLEVEYELARRLDLADSFPWKTTEEWIDYRLKPSGIAVQDLKGRPITTVTPPLEYRKYLKEGFNTSSKKVELYSEVLKSYGYNPLPTYRDPGPPPYRDYALIGTTRRPGHYVHTRFRNISMLRDKQPEPFVRIHPQDAKVREIQDGCWTVVESPQGRIRIKAKVANEVLPGTVLIDFGWGNPGDQGANVNILTSDGVRDPLCSTTPNRRFLCEVKRG